jgi:hypothetical protein
MLSVTLHYTPALVRRAAFAYVRRGLGRGGWVALAVSVATLGYLVLSERDSWLAGAASGVGAAFFLFLVGLYFLHYRQGMAKLARMGEPHAVLQLTDSNLVVASQAGSSSIPWGTFTDLWRFPDFWLLIVDKGQFMTLPLSDLTEDARSFIVSRLGANGRHAA